MTPEELRKRHSVRAFTDVPISDSDVKALKAEITMTNCHEAGLHFQLFFNEPDPFKGFSRSYGFFINPRNYLACVVDNSFPDTMERAGYYAEQFVMKAVSLGLGTCFIGGTYESLKVKARIRAGEQLLFLVLFGYPADKERVTARLLTRLIHRKDHHPRDFFEGDDKEYEKALSFFTWLREGLAGVACSPSSLNRQPVRIKMKGEGKENALICAGVDTKVEKNLIDLGIAKFNFASAAGGDWEWGNWSPFWKSESQE